jgi:hypothetical protein
MGLVISWAIVRFFELMNELQIMSKCHFQVTSRFRAGRARDDLVHIFADIELHATEFFVRGNLLSTRVGTMIGLSDPNMQK